MKHSSGSRWYSFPSDCIYSLLQQRYGVRTGLFNFVHDGGAFSLSSILCKDQFTAGTPSLLSYNLSNQYPGGIYQSLSSYVGCGGQLLVP